MASSLISSSLHVSFDSVLTMEDTGIVTMFGALVASGLKGFLGCPAIFYEDSLEEFFQNGSVRDGTVFSTIQGMSVEISEEIFAGAFELPMDGLTDLSDVLNDLVFDARSIFSDTGKQVSTSCKKREMKIEFRLLSDILAKSIFVKAGSFDAVTHERFLLMAAITEGVQTNWGRLLFNIFKEMVTVGSRQAKGFAIQICVLLKNVPTLELGDSIEFPSRRILTAKIVHRYVVINEKVTVDGVADEPRVKRTLVKKAVSRKRPATAEVVESVLSKKKRTIVGKADKGSVLITVAQEAVPLQIVEPTSAAPAEQPPTVPRDEETDQWFNLSYEEFIAQEADRPFVTASDIDEEMETVDLGTSVGEQQLQIFDENESSVDASAAYIVIEPEAETVKDQGTDIPDVVPAAAVKVSDDETMTIDEILLTIPADCPLPSALGEITKIKLGKSISIPGVNEGDWYKDSLPKISVDAKGKAPLVIMDPIKGNPAKEQYSLICADIEVLVQLREKVIDEVEQFFNSFSLKKLAVLKIEDFYVKEEQVLTWAETDSTREALQRILYILTKAIAVVEPTPVFGSRRPTVTHWGWYQQCTVFARHCLFGGLSTVDIRNFVSTIAEDRSVLRNIQLVQFEQIRQRNDADKLKDILLLHIRDLEKQVNARFYEHDRAYRALLTNIRKDMHDHKPALSLDVVKSQQRISTQVAAAAFDTVDVRKEVKELKAKVIDLDGQVATIRSEFLDFRAKAEENHLHLSTQLGFLDDYINRGGDAKKGEGGNSRPQPPPDDQYRPSGGSGSRADDPSRYGGGTISR
ncbi:hypothetical protein F511_19423 [Dorcoceras hygrometricum]|uniref:Dystroglycan-like n=1 Tax=Dorcoceras hygrometricum TaxID=472368 RepID=A0A2Z7CKU4_9LAMI|nr:hypothetical protein F511_19423 [Dorcoceras hygrometricum]